MPPIPPVNLLWTGGWDSTYQLLRLVLDHRRPVQPFYLADGNRASTRIEIETMDSIRRRIAETHPETHGLLLPTRYSRVQELAPDPDIEEAFARIRRRSFIGDQYAWLARFCRQCGIEDVELSVEYSMHGAHAALERALEPVEAAGGYPSYRIDPRQGDTDEYRVFRYFSFPLFDITKLQMLETVREREWTELMGMTWFCHRPRSDRQPCGCCNPCLYAIEQGFGWRIPPRRRALSAVYRLTVKPVKGTLKALVGNARRGRMGVPSPDTPT